MVNAFKEELKHNEKAAWFGFIRTYSHNFFFIFKHREKGQRTVKCKECEVMIPKEVPRIYISGNWYYRRGHYCLKCAIKWIEEDIQVKTNLLNDLKENISSLNSLLNIAKRTTMKEEFKDYIALGYLVKKIGSCDNSIY